MEAASVTAPAGRAAGRGGRLLRLRSDDQLVALFRLGNDDAFRVIHDRYRVRLLAYTRQMLAGSHADAEDALQDVLLRASWALRADDRPVTLRAWLYRVAHNRCVDHLRRPANQPTDELAEVATEHDPLADVQRRDDLRCLVADVRRLPEQQRSALLMREMEGLTYAELSDALGATVPSVKSLLVRARIGLTEAREARDTACTEIRMDLAAAHDKGVRVSGLARRHLRECAPCTEYRTRLRGVRAGLAALGGGPTGVGVLAKLLGLGGAGGGAAATAGGGGAVAGGAIAAGGTAKVAALVCCAAVMGGGAVEASREWVKRPAPAQAQARAKAPRATVPRPPLAPASAVAATLMHPASVAAPAAPVARAAAPADERVAPEAVPAVAPDTPAAEPAPAPVAEPVAPSGPSADDEVRQAAAAGGMLAPEEAPPAAEPPAPDPVTEPAAGDPPAAASPPTAPEPVSAPADPGTPG